MYTCSNSRAVIITLQSKEVESKLTRECHKTLKSLAEDRVVELLWIPGPSGFRGNEIADESGTANYGPKTKAEILRTNSSHFNQR